MANIGEYIEDSINITLRQKLPAGEIRTLADFGIKTPSFRTPIHVKVPSFKAEAFGQNILYIDVDTDNKVTQRGIDASSTKILPIGSTIISARGTVGRLALVGVPMAMNQSCYGLRGKQGEKGFFNYFSTRALISVLQQRTHGSVFDTITRDTLAGVQMVMPPSPIVNAFEEIAGSTMNSILQHVLQSRTLSDLRDTLLPKLITGKLTVNDAEKFIGRLV